jgi:hypothetical protein
MRRSLQCFLVVVGLLAVGLAGPLWAQAPAVILDVLNPVTPGTNVAVVVQGDPVQVQFAVSPLVDSSPSDLIRLRRLDNETVVSQQTRGDLTGTASLDTTPSSALGDLEVVYVLSATGNVLATAPQTVRVVSSGPGGPTSVTVPSPAARTIQAGIDLVADGGTIQIRPGIYRERLLVVGKRVNLVGSGSFGLRRTVIAGTLPRTIVPYQQAQGLVSFGPGGGGSISNLILQGSDAGIVGFGNAGGVPAAVQIKDAVIRLTGRGVLGSFSRLEIDRAVIVGARWHGLSVVQSANLGMFESSIIAVDGVGVFVDNTHESSGSITISGATIYNCAQGGIVVAGDAKPVCIDSCYIGVNWVAGIRLWDAGPVTVTNTDVWSVYLGNTEADGVVYEDLAYGLLAFQSDAIAVDNCNFIGCEKAGIIYDSSGGVITNTWSGANPRFGLVLQGEPKPDYSDPNNVFSGAEENILTDGDLPVPGPPPLP